MQLTAILTLDRVFSIYNKLSWLPQRPVYNYHHCEFRFWRNHKLKTIPYSLWYHMFRDQQTRSLNIGCLSTSDNQDLPSRIRCRLKLQQDSGEWEVNVLPPPQYRKILENNENVPPSLYELCKRKFYQMLCSATKKVASNNMYINYSTFNGNDFVDVKEKDDIQNSHKIFPFNNQSMCDINGNSGELKLIPTVYKRGHTKSSNFTRDRENYHVPADIIENDYSYLPKFIKLDLTNGPASRCENINCKTPIFDYVTYEFTFGKIILIDSTEDVILSATFCSKCCADVWKRNKADLISWQLVK